MHWTFFKQIKNNRQQRFAQTNLFDGLNEEIKRVCDRKWVEIERNSRYVGKNLIMARFDSCRLLLQYPTNEVISLSIGLE